MRATDQPISASAGLSAGIGLRLRELRAARGLSLSELARRSGVGKATLSGLEAGTRNPTLETLYALTTALGLPLSAALPAPEPPAGEAGGEAAVSGRVLDAVLLERFEDAAAVSETYRIRIRPGGVQRSAAHPPGTVEHLVVLAGTALVGAGADLVEVGPGGHHSWAADVPHRYRAAARQEVAAVLVVRHPHRWPHES
ncbi:helix-turn-helix domain-containing protein [Kitasatospora cineracea]|uniref:XRE family transcriptional regulator n=1 Tax=Kitasatospora cineracea TaxID=88074 RepID=A0A3N4RTZ1_9ACTN|nr:XRE family transcriptional regulator [Kitasatospora cineracea]ROR46001.1 XRE family transcriptional regulator [Kitasatospora cineracea]RPE36376.1 XRE family transcriptional regulator [Kitasatospora cineracea]